LKKPTLATRELAVIIEHATMTGGGAICVFLLVITLAASVFSLIAATTIFQQIEAGLFLLVGCVLFGLGIALGHKRTYRVYRSEHRDPM
jgi:NO-binding membrane sensor protein with MHYT domain